MFCSSSGQFKIRASDLYTRIIGLNDQSVVESVKTKSNSQHFPANWFFLLLVKKVLVAIQA